jgi:hypothetical protein
VESPQGDAAGVVRSTRTARTSAATATPESTSSNARVTAIGVAILATIAHLGFWFWAALFLLGLLNLPANVVDFGAVIASFALTILTWNVANEIVDE